MRAVLLVWLTAAVILAWAIALTVFAGAGVRAARRREFGLGSALWGRPRDQVQRFVGREAVGAGVTFAIGFGLFAAIAWVAFVKLVALGWSLPTDSQL